MCTSVHVLFMLLFVLFHVVLKGALKRAWGKYLQDCDSPWAMTDVAKVCGNEASTLAELARRSLDQMTAQAGQWRSCPTPECSFAWNEELSADAQGVKQMGRVTVCPSCTNAVCFRWGKSQLLAQFIRVMWHPRV